MEIDLEVLDILSYSQTDEQDILSSADVEFKVVILSCYLPWKHSEPLLETQHVARYLLS